MNRRLSLLVVIFWLPFTGCATLSNDDESITINETSEVSFKAIKTTLVTAESSYRYDGKPHKVEWFSCSVKDAVATVLVMHEEGNPFKKPYICSSWSSQAFAAQKLNVLAVNRPGYGRSSGSVDVIGSHSLTAIHSAYIDASRRLPQLTNLTGIWGYSLGATAAALYARKFKGLDWLILGGGVYDFEQAAALSKSPFMRLRLSKAIKMGPSEIEKRSIAFDIEGLPKKIFIYHGKDDSRVPVQLAESFRDTLLSMEYPVKLEVLSGVSHKIAETTHRKVLDILIKASFLSKPSERR